MSSLDLSSLMGISLGTLTLGKVISAAVTLLICLVVIRVLMKLLNRLLSRSKLDTRVQKYLAAGVRLILYVITALIVVDSPGHPHYLSGGPFVRGLPGHYPGSGGHSGQRGRAAW